ncbi:MAG: WavE lipopolysaccharide synthesis family protein [Myxococcales bacterium]|nr:WavE lipopolysaccharide synthesis family protein [Myxococcales bacterium]MDH3485666.1 WavE lipopolysaccharide synthesis family protein [Myxococcales bacterium]
MGEGPKSIPSLLTRARRRALRSIVVRLNQQSDEYTTYRGRPKAAAAVGTWTEREVQADNAAVVMQGPPYEPDNFTLETLKLYARHMPNAHLILSTWRDTSPAILDPIRQLGADVVLNDKPDKPGLFNINMQLASAKTGVQRAVELGAEWVLKTRTDQRLYQESFMSMLISMAKTFPVASGYEQRFRIFGVGQGSLKYAPYHVTDQTVFGHAEDMLKYWDVPPKLEDPPVHWPKNLREVYHQVPVGELCRSGAAESRLASGFLERVGRPLSWTLVDHWKALRDHFCFVDHGMVDLYWVKAQTYTFGKEHARDLEEITNRKEIGFGEWMLLYSGQLPPEAATRYEGVLQQPFVERVANAD